MLTSRAPRVLAGVASSVVLLTCVLFWPGAGDPVNVVKLLVLTTGATVAVGVCGWHLIRHRFLRLSIRPEAAAATVLMLALILAAAGAPEATTALVGTVGRNSGLLAYVSALVLFLLTVLIVGREGAVWIAGGILLGGVFTATYGLLQYVGWDAIAWNNPFNPIIGSLGNPDFASAYLGIAVPVAASAAAWSRPATGWRWAAAAAALTLALVAILSSAVQGPLASVLGLLPLVIVLRGRLSAPWRRRADPALALSLMGATTFGIVTAVGLGPVGGLRHAGSSQARLWYWQGAIAMWHSHPWRGVGLSAYGVYWRRDRPFAATRALGGEHYSDSAHNVPLQHLAEGGLVLLLAYLIFTVLVGRTLVLGMRRTSGDDRLLLAAVGGAWMAYQFQSLVSIDQIPLLVAGFLSAAAVVVVAGRGREVSITLPGAVKAEPARQAKGRRRNLPERPRLRPLAGTDAVAFTVLTAVLIGLTWWAAKPFHANVLEHRGDVAYGAGDAASAKVAYTAATELEPGVGAYWTRLANADVVSSDQTGAKAAFATAFERDQIEIQAGRAAARGFALGGDHTRAYTLLAELRRVDPQNPATVLPFVEEARVDDKPEQAVVALRYLLRVFPKNGDALAVLGDVLAGTGDLRAARMSYEQALAVEPGQATATIGIAKLGPG